MKRFGAFLTALAIVVACGLTASSQPPEGKEKKGFGKEKGFPRFQLGNVIPPHVRPDLGLSPEQEAQLTELEKDVRDRLSKILSAEQRRKIEEARPPMGGFGKGDQPPAKKGPPAGKDGERAAAPTAGIQWFATWESGLAEAKRTNRPILFVSAAPHCAGVSGMW